MNRDAAIEQVDARAEAVRAYEGTELHTHVIGLLEALISVYMHELVDVSPEQLQLKQGALRQVMALRAAASTPAATARL